MDELMKVHPSQRKLLAAIRKKPEATFKELQRMTGISSTCVVDYHLTKMMVAGLIRKVNRYEILVSLPANARPVKRDGERR